MKSWAKAKLSQSAYAEGGVYPNWFAGAFYVYFVYFCWCCRCWCCCCILCVFRLRLHFAHLCFARNFLWVISLWHVVCARKGESESFPNSERVYAEVYMCVYESTIQKRAKVTGRAYFIVRRRIRKMIKINTRLIICAICKYLLN